MANQNEFSFSSSELFVNPYPIYAEMREKEPIKYTSMYGGAWVFFKYEDADFLLKDPRVTNDRSTLPVKALPEDQRQHFSKFTELLSKWTAFYEGNEHRIRRSSLNQAFKPLTPNFVKSLTQETAASLLSKWSEGQEVDIVSEFAAPLSSIILTRLIGAPEKDHHLLDIWSRDISYLFAASDINAKNMSNAWNSAQAMMDYLTELMHAATPLPEPSILASLKNTPAKNYQFSVEDACAQCVLLFFAALEPNRDIIGNALHALDAYPEQRALLQADQTLWANAVNEFLRFDPPVQYIGRMAAESFNYRGHHIKKGQMIFPHVGSANRDPEKYEQAERLNVLREATNLSMGEGIHRCIGYRMVKVQAEFSLRALFEKFPNLKVKPTSAPEWNAYAGFHGLRRLEVIL